MPTYDYECDACGHEWELFQKMTDDPVKKCPACNKRKARRLFGTGAAVMFKGSGFYETDYRSESYKKSAKADKELTSKGDAGEAKSDAKSSDTKSDSATTKSESKPASDPKPKSDGGSKKKKKD